jgi:hypothetical protein
MSRIMMLEPKRHLNGWLASDLRGGGIGEIHWFLSGDQAREAAGLRE